MNPKDENEHESVAIEALLDRATSRRGWRAVSNAAAWGVATGALAAMIVVLYDRLLGSFESSLWSVGAALALPVVGAILAGGIAAWKTRRSTADESRLDSALEIEHHIKLDERLSSAITLPDSIDVDVRQACRRDGERFVPSIDLRQAIPINRPRGLIPALGLLIVTATMFFIPQFDLAGVEKERIARAEAVERTEKSRERLEERLRALERRAKDVGISKQTAEWLGKLEKQAKERADRPRQSKRAKRELLVDLDRLREEGEALKQRGDLAKLKRALDTVRSVGASPDSELGKKLARSLDRGNFGDASDAMRALSKELSKLGDSPADQAKREALLRDLDTLMKKVGDLAGDPDKLKKALEKAKEQGIDPGKLAESLENAAAKFDQLQRLMRERDIIDSALGEISFSEDELASLPREWPDQSELAAQQCESCRAGDGEGECSGGGCPGAVGQRLGRARGRGPGGGQIGETGPNGELFTDLKVRSNKHQGAPVRTLLDDGEVPIGNAALPLEEAIRAGERYAERAIEEERYPADYRELPRRYFEKIRPKQ